MNESANIDVSPGVARLATGQVRLDLSTVELVFLALLRDHSRAASLAAFTEEQLGDAFANACSLVNPEAENIGSRTTHAIRRLREQRLLVRVDGAGVLRAGEFALTSLASGIVDFFLDDQTLTQTTLTVLLTSLDRTLSELVLLVENTADRSPNWSDQVAEQLTVSASDLLSGIERRARGLDLQQADFQQQVAALLSAEWFGAIERCQTLLDETAQALQELNQLLLAHAHPLVQQLESLHDACLEAKNEASATCAKQLADRVEQLGEWASARGTAWSEYYEYIHRYLRDVVRLDPNRALSQRLRQHLNDHAERPYALTVARAQPLRLLRAVELKNEPPPVIRRKKDREPKLEERPLQSDPMEVLEQQVRAELEGGAKDLSTITMQLTRDLGEKERFLAAGRIAQTVSKLTRPLRVPERPWVRLEDSLCIEERAMLLKD